MLPGIARVKTRPVGKCLCVTYLISPPPREYAREPVFHAHARARCRGHTSLPYTHRPSLPRPHIPHVRAAALTHDPARLRKGIVPEMLKKVLYVPENVACSGSGLRECPRAGARNTVSGLEIAPRSLSPSHA